MHEEYEKVLKLFEKLLDQSIEVEVDTGCVPIAQEALTWAISEVNISLMQMDVKDDCYK